MNKEQQDNKVELSLKLQRFTSSVKRIFLGLTVAASMALPAMACNESDPGTISAEQHMDQMNEDREKYGESTDLLATQTALDKQNGTNYSDQNPSPETNVDDTNQENEQPEEHTKSYEINSGDTLGKLYQRFLNETGLNSSPEHWGLLKRNGQEITRFFIADFGYDKSLDNIQIGDTVVFSNLVIP